MRKVELQASENTELSVQEAIRLLKSELGIISKPGRPVNPNSKRQQRIRLGSVRYDKPGRPVNPTSERQKRLQEQLQSLQQLKEQLKKD